jgi:hypothetical protein
VSDSPAAADAWADGIIAELDKISSSELILLQIRYDLLDETKLTAPGAHIPPIDGLVADENPISRKRAAVLDNGFLLERKNMREPVRCSWSIKTHLPKLFDAFINKGMHSIR